MGRYFEGPAVTLRFRTGGSSGGKKDAVYHPRYFRGGAICSGGKTAGGPEPRRRPQLEAAHERFAASECVRPCSAGGNDLGRPRSGRSLLRKLVGNVVLH